MRAWDDLTMTRRDDYLRYLKSTEWRENRNFALDRTSGFCQYCGEVATQVHHVKYPKRFGEEHPHSLIPICERCHNISHGVQEMKAITDVAQFTELTPNGGRLRYLLSGARVYASAKSWARALQVPECRAVWFETGLSRIAILKKDLAGGELEMSYLNTAVYRWHAVAEQLRAFDREWNSNQFKSRPKQEQRELEQFYQNYDRLVSWGYDLQERALSSALNGSPSTASSVTQETLIEAMKEVVAPRLRSHDDKLHEHDLVIADIVDAVPTLRDQDEFITVKQAINEKGFDSTMLPLYPKSRENLSGLTGRILKDRNTEQGSSVIARIDGQSTAIEMNTYRRRDVYSAMDDIVQNKQYGLTF